MNYFNFEKIGGYVEKVFYIIFKLAIIAATIMVGVAVLKWSFIYLFM